MPEDYVVQQGESVLSIAVARGFFWETLWNHANNSALKSKRKDPDILMPGDILHIPDRAKKQESKSTDAEHKFKVKGQKAKFKLTLLRQPKDPDLDKPPPGAKEWWKYVDEPRKDAKPEPMDFIPYELYADGILIKKDTTTREGALEAPLPLNAQSGILILNKDKPDQCVLELHFREMDPLTEFSGIGKRLYNLGFPCPTDATELTQPLKNALAAFQKREGLKVTGDADDATRDKLKQLYGG